VTIHISDTFRQAGLGPQIALAASGKWVIYAGPVPTSTAAALGSAVELVRFTLGSPAYGSAQPDGSRLLQGVPLDAAAGATGTASFARLLNSSDAVLVQGLVDVSGGEVAGAVVNLSSLSMTSGQTISLTYGAITQ
jgi:hypothetical protein